MVSPAQIRLPVGSENMFHVGPFGAVPTVPGATGYVLVRLGLPRIPSIKVVREFEDDGSPRFSLLSADPVGVFVGPDGVEVLGRVVIWDTVSGLCLDPDVCGGRADGRPVEGLHRLVALLA